MHRGNDKNFKTPNERTSNESSKKNPRSQSGEKVHGEVKRQMLKGKKSKQNNWGFIEDKRKRNGEGS